MARLQVALDGTMFKRATIMPMVIIFLRGSTSQHEGPIVHTSFVMTRALLPLSDVISFTCCLLIRGGMIVLLIEDEDDANE